MVMRPRPVRAHIRASIAPKNTNMDQYKNIAQLSQGMFNKKEASHLRECEDKHISYDLQQLFHFWLDLWA
jgi:hypothetical protein